MSTNVYHVDQNVIYVELDDNQSRYRKINKEKLKIMLQISGCKPSHSFQISERIFEQIFVKLAGIFNLYHFFKKENFDKQKCVQVNQKALNSVTVQEKYFKDLVTSSVFEKKYMIEKGDSYKDDFQIAWTLTERKQPLIILLGGTSGTGKSTASSILASRFGISTVLSTDSIRHIMRNFLSKEDTPVLFASTYEAGKYIEQSQQLSDQRRIIKGYKMQCEIVQQKLEHVIQTFESRNDSIIIEGVHLTPFFMLKIMKKYKRVLPFAICISKESKHKERFAVRSKYMTLDSRNNKYVENFPNIRLIQKWFLEKADECLIPKVDNVNIDKSIDNIHQTIIQYMRKIINQPELDLSDIKNALPIYEEYNKVKKNAFSTKELKDYIHSKVNKNEIYEQFLQQMETIKKENSIQEVIQDQTSTSNATDQEGKNLGPKRRLEQSVQKFNEINLKNEKQNHQQDQNTEANYIIEEQVENKDNVNHLSDSEDQNEERRRRNQDNNQNTGMKKTKSLKSLFKLNNVEQLKEQDDSPIKQFEDAPIQEQEVVKSPIKVQFQSLTVETQDLDHEQTPQKTDYKGILQHLSKHKRIFLSKKTKPSNLVFIRKMISNYNKNDQSSDKMRLIQNPDGSYCLFKINIIKSTKKIEQNKEDSSSDQDESEFAQSNIQYGRSQMTPTNFPFSERRDQSEGDSIRFHDEQESDENEELENINSVEESESEEEEEQQLQAFKNKMYEEDGDSFKLEKINEEEEFQDEDQNTDGILLKLVSDQSPI